MRALFRLFEDFLGQADRQPGRWSECAPELERVAAVSSLSKFFHESIRAAQIPAKLAIAACHLLPEQSKARRLVEGVSAIVIAADEAVVLHDKRTRSRWHGRRCAMTRAEIDRYGTVLRIDDHGQALVSFGEHHLVTDGEEWFASASSHGDLARTAVELRLAELGCGRLQLTNTGMQADRPYEGLTSPTAIRLTETLQRELESGAPSRTLLLLGPPGSGKSVLARQIADALADALADRVVTMTSQMLLTETYSSGAVAFLEALRPGALVLDDYDRIDPQSVGVSLDTIDRLRAACRVVIFTANSLDTLGPAQRRPGRFDRIEIIDHLDIEIARRMAASLPDSVREEAAEKLLAGYLAELVVRVRAGADARVELDVLLERQAEAEDGSVEPVDEHGCVTVEAIAR